MALIASVGLGLTVEQMKWTVPLVEAWDYLHVALVNQGTPTVWPGERAREEEEGRRVAEALRRRFALRE